MRDGDDGLDAHHGGQPLQRVERSEEVTHGSWVRSPLPDRCVDVEEPGVGEGKLLLRLGKVCAEELPQVDGVRQPVVTLLDRRVFDARAT